jgi:hypothetical protein
MNIAIIPKGILSMDEVDLMEEESEVKEDIDDKTSSNAMITTSR